MGLSHKLVVIAPLSAPVDTKSGGRIHLVSKALVDRGIAVEVLSLAASNVGEFLHVLDNVQYKFYAITQKTNEIFLNKIFLKVRIYFSVFFTCLFKLDRNSIVLFFPNCDFRFLLMILCRLRGLKIVMEINEYPLVGRTDGILVRLKRFIIFSLTFPLCSGFIVISDTLKELVIKYAKSKVGVIKIPVIAVNPEFSVENLKSPVVFPYILHVGSLNEQKDGITGMLECFSALVERINFSIRMIFTGDLNKSQDSEEILNAIERLKLKDYVIFLGYLSTKELELYMSFASAAIVNKKENIQNKYCFATKISEYLSWGIPVVTTNYGEAMNFLINGENSIIVEKNDYFSMSAAIQDLIENPEKYNELKKKSRELFKLKFEYSNYSEVLYQFFTQLK